MNATDPTKVRDMMRGIAWGSRMTGNAPAHMLRLRKPLMNEHALAYCGVWVMPWERKSLLDAVVCRRCFNVTYDGKA